MPPEQTKQTTPAPGAKTAAAAPVRQPKMKVEAISDGYYDNKLRRTGDVFFISGTLPTPQQLRRGDGSMRDPKLPIMFSSKWMKPAPPEAPLSNKGPNDVIRENHDAVQAARASGGAAPPADDDPLGADDAND